MQVLKYFDYQTFCLETFTAPATAEITLEVSERKKVTSAKITITAGFERANGRESFSAISVLKGKKKSAPKKMPMTEPIEPIIKASEKINFWRVAVCVPSTRKIEYSRLRSFTIKEKTIARVRIVITSERIVRIFGKIRKDSIFCASCDIKEPPFIT